MKKLSFVTINSHTCGEPTRLLIGQLPLKGDTMHEKREFLKNNYDFIRKILINEPRGHEGMFGAILTSPVESGSDFGILFFDTKGYLDMCGHSIIGVTGALIESGYVKKEYPIAKITFDTPVGKIETVARIDEQTEEVKEVTFTNVPSFLYKKGVEIRDKETAKTYSVDIAFGGNFFVLINMEKSDIQIDPENIYWFKKTGKFILEEINNSQLILHPQFDFIKNVELALFYKLNKGEKPLSFKNVAVFGMAQVDRSPCGTGTSALMASLYAAGELGLNQKIVSHGIIPTTEMKMALQGEIKQETKVKNYDAVITQITGHAFVTGISIWILNPHDPLREGFLL